MNHVTRVLTTESVTTLNIGLIQAPLSMRPSCRPQLMATIALVPLLALYVFLSCLTQYHRVTR